MIGRLGALWGAVGLFAVIGKALWSLSFWACEALQMDLTGLHWGVLGVWVLFMAYAEGYKGFQKSFSPRTPARAHYIAVSPNWSRVLLAPLFCMGFFDADRRTKIVAYALTFGITILVLLVRMLDQPWRGIIDAGVVVGLSWGLLSLGASLMRAFALGGPSASACVPQGRDAENEETEE